ncbi:cache domain-containing protein, partial [Anaeromicrobium sediminis]
MKSLKYKIMTPVFVLSTIGILILSFFAHGIAKEIITSYVELAVEDKAEKLVSYVDHKLEAWEGQLELLASTDKAKKLDYEGFLKHIWDKKDLFKDHEVVLISDRKGDFIASDGTRGNVADRTYFNKALKGESAISAFSISKTTGNPIIVISVPIMDDYENVVGLVASTVNLYQVTDIINAEKLGDSGYAYIINSQGLTIAHPRKEFLLNDTLAKSESNTLREIIAKMKNGKEGIGYYNFEDIKKIIAFKPVKSVDWTIGMTASFDEVSENVSMLQNNILLIGIIIVISILTSLYFITNSLVK